MLNNTDRLMKENAKQEMFFRRREGQLLTLNYYVIITSEIQNTNKKHHALENLNNNKHRALVNLAIINIML